jgi:glycosyltransferase involved in cell wall biosynthesis
MLRLYRMFKPDIVHHLTVKPVLYGGIVARLARVPVRVHAFMGLGHLFNANDLSTRVLRGVLWPLFRFAIGGRGSVVIVQNSDDASVIGKALGGDENSRRVRLIKGSGVEPSQFDPAAVPEDPPLVLFAGRLLKTKGLVEFVEAAHLVRQSQPEVRFIICGKPYEHNPAAIDEAQVRSWAAQGVVEWWGHREDMPAILGRSTMVVLPSWYGEGVPRILIEAAAAGRPIITTDSPGCREIARDRVNGVLVPCGDSVALASAVERLLGDPEERCRMGREGRRIVEGEFSLEQVIVETFAVYEQMLAERSMAWSTSNLGGPL